MFFYKISHTYRHFFDFFERNYNLNPKPMVIG